MHAKEVIRGKYKGPDVQGVAALPGYPIPVHSDELPQALEERLFVERGYAEALAGTIEPRMVFLRAENSYTIARISECLESLEDRLTVVKRAHARRDFDIAEGDNARRLPLTLLVIKQEHVVRKYFTEAQVIKVYSRQTAVRDSL
jgi:hypothetical protein